MSQWSVKGVDKQTQVLAKKSASRAGLSVGQWLDKHIRLQTELSLDRSEVKEQVVEKTKNQTTQSLRQENSDYLYNKRFLYFKFFSATIFKKRARLAILSVTTLLLAGGGYTIWKNPNYIFNEAATIKTSNEQVLLNMQLSRLQKLANEGDGFAQLELGKRFLKGVGVSTDAVRAYSLFIKSSNNGVADAMFQLAYLYEQGLGVPADQEKATSWYKRAVAEGSAKAATKIKRIRKDPNKLEQKRGQLTQINKQATPSEKNIPLTTDEITELQQLLTELDLFSSSITGILDQETISALKLYQNFAGLPTDGKPTNGLLIDLRQVVAAMSEQSAVK